MATRSQSPSQHDLELLSAYLDGELSDRERIALEKRLSQEGTLRATLDGLRETVTLVQHLPRLKAPRNFTLDPAVYGQAAPWWRRLFTLGTMMQVSGALGAAASIVIIALAFVLSNQSTSKDGALVNEPMHAESQQTAVGFIAEPSLPTSSQAPSTLPATATMVKALTPTQTPLPTAAFAVESQDSAAAAGAVDSAVMPTSEAAILNEPAPSEQDAYVPPAAVGQTVEEGTAPDESGENGLFAAPEPAGTVNAPPTGGEAAYDDVSEAEPLVIATATSTPTVEALQESAAAATLLLPSPTLSATKIQITPTVEAAREKINGEESDQQRASAETDEDQSNIRLLVAGLGAVLFIISAGLLIAGRRRR